jgi:hypothetical protein
VLKPSLEESRTALPPLATVSEEEWERSGWIVEVGQGKNNALCLPVYSEVVSRQAYDLLSEEEKDRCVFDIENGGLIYYCPRNQVDKVRSTRGSIWPAVSTSPKVMRAQTVGCT